MLRGVGDVYRVPTCASTPVTSFTVSPTSVNLALNGSASLTTIARNSCGQVTGGQHVTWQSSDASIVSVDNYGNINGVSPGSALITARHEATGLTSSLYVDVTKSETGCKTQPNEPTCIEPMSVKPVSPGKPE